MWVTAGPHPTQTSFGLDGFPERAVDGFGNVLRESRYEMADAHITIRAGSGPYLCQVSGHLYVSLDKNGIPRPGVPSEAVRKYVDSGDYRVDQTWVWNRSTTKQALDAQWGALVATGLDPEAYNLARPKCKRVHDDGDYSPYYDTHEHACKKQLIRRNEPVKDARTYVPKPASGVFLSKEVLADLEEREEEKKLKIDKQKLQQKLQQTQEQIRQLRPQIAQIQQQTQYSQRQTRQLESQIDRLEQQIRSQINQQRRGYKQRQRLPPIHQLEFRVRWLQQQWEQMQPQIQNELQRLDQLRNQENQLHAQKQWQLQEQMMQRTQESDLQRRQWRTKQVLQKQRPQHTQALKQWQLETQRLLQIRV